MVHCEEQVTIYNVYSTVAISSCKNVYEVFT